MKKLLAFLTLATLGFAQITTLPPAGGSPGGGSSGSTELVFEVHDQGLDDAYSATESESGNCPVGFTDGLIVLLTVDTTNTGAATLDFCGSGALTITNRSGTTLANGQLPAFTVIALRFVDDATDTWLAPDNPGSGCADGDKGDITVGSSCTDFQIDAGAVGNTEVAAGVAATKLADGSVTDAEFQRINSLTSNAQDQIDAKVSAPCASLASQAEAEAGTENTKCTTALRVAQAIAALAPAGNVTVKTGTGDPNTDSETCTDPAGGTLTVYFETATNEIWDCNATDTWVFRLNGGTTGPFGLIGEKDTTDPCSASVDADKFCLSVDDTTGKLKVKNEDEVVNIMLSNRDPIVVEVELFAAGVDNATGDGKAYFRIPARLDGMILAGISGNVYTAGTTGTVNVDIARCATAATGNVCSGTVSDVLSTNLTIDSGENSSSTAATAAVIDTANDDVSTGQIIRFDVDAVHTTAAQGLLIELIFQLP